MVENSPSPVIAQIISVLAGRGLGYFYTKTSHDSRGPFWIFLTAIVIRFPIRGFRDVDYHLLRLVIPLPLIPISSSYQISTNREVSIITRQLS